MKLEVIIGKKESGKGRIFETIKEASFYMKYHERLDSGIKIESKPKYQHEIKRMVYQNTLGEKRYYILKIIN